MQKTNENIAPDMWQRTKTTAKMFFSNVQCQNAKQVQSKKKC